MDGANLCLHRSSYENSEVLIASLNKVLINQHINK